MLHWTVLLLAPLATFALDITPEVQPRRPICQLSECRFGDELFNCTLRNLTIAKARPVTAQRRFSSGHLFALLHDPSGCMFLTLELTTVQLDVTSYTLQLLVGNDLEPDNVLTNKFETPEQSELGCFRRMPTYTCVSHVFEQFRLTVYDDESFALEDGSESVPPGTRMEFRTEGKTAVKRICSRGQNPNFWKSLDWTRRCYMKRLSFEMSDDSPMVVASHEQDLSFGIIVGILMVLWFLWLLAVGLRKFYIKFILGR